MSNIFNLLGGTNEELLDILKQAVAALEAGNIVVTDITITSAPLAQTNGLTQDEKSFFLGFAFKPKEKSPLKEKEVFDKLSKVAPPLKTMELDSDIDDLDGLPPFPVVKKSYPPRCTPPLTDAQLPLFKKDDGYKCPCCFVSRSARGFKKHYNRCIFVHGK